MNTEEFYKLPKDLAKADGFISKKTGEMIKITSSGKLVYSYMLTRNEFFVRKLNGDHFESQATVAEACGIEYKAAGRILRDFVEHEAIVAHKGKPDRGGQWRWYYTSVSKDIVLWVENGGNFVLLDEQPKKPVKQYTAKAKQPQPVQTHYEEDLPF